MSSLQGKSRIRRLAGTALPTLLLVFAGQAQATDLSSVYQQARDYDASLQAAEYDYAAARERVPQARSALLPQLAADAQGGYSRLLGSSIGGDRDFFSSSLSLTLRQNLFNVPNRAALDQAETSVLQAEAQYLAEDQGLIIRVAEAYFNVLRAQASVEFSQSELKAIGRQRDQAERRFDVGLVPVTDVREAQAQYDLAVAREILASNQLSTAREALRLVSGVEPETRLDTLAEDLPLERPDPEDVEAWVEAASEQNLELLFNRLGSEAARQQLRIERGARYPSVDLQGIATSANTDRPQSQEGETAELRLQLSLPLYTGGRIGAQVAQAQAEYLASAERLKSLERSTAQQTRDAYRAVVAAISQVRALREALQSTQQSYDAIDAGFRAGTRTSVDVLQALRDTFSARSDYASARYDYIINTLNLRFAAGTLTAEDLDQVNGFLVPADVGDSEEATTP